MDGCDLGDSAGAAQQKCPNQLCLAFDHALVDRALPDPARRKAEGIAIQDWDDVVKDALVDTQQRVQVLDALVGDPVDEYGEALVWQ